MIKWSGFNSNYLNKSDDKEATINQSGANRYLMYQSLLKKN